MIINSPAELPKKRIVVALGVFDGVHLGHQELFRKALEVKSRTGCPVMCLTFEPHPRAFLGLDRAEDFRLLTLSDEKKALMAEMGCDYYWALPFNQEVSRMSPEDFARKILQESLNVCHAVCGFNFSFGYKGLGRPEDLSDFGRKLGFRVTVVGAVNFKGQLVSSSRVRSQLDSGDVESAHLCLGRPYCVTGRVEHGDGRGKLLGVPTSNVTYHPQKALPSNGVYWGVARWLDFREENRGTISVVEGVCAVNVGTRPTFGASRVTVEVHIPGASMNLYGRTMEVFFLGKLREERLFESAKALKTQIQMDLDYIAKKKKDVLSGVPDGTLSISPFFLKGAYDRIFQDLP